MHKLRAFNALTSASVKMYFRNRTALFFTLFLPVIFILIFGVLNFGKGGAINVDLINHSTSPLAKQYIETVNKTDVFKVKAVSEAKAQDDLAKGKADVQLVVPVDFGNTTKPGANTIQAYYNQARAQNGQTASLVLQQVASEMSNAISKVKPLIAVKAVAVKTRNQTYIDFLIPGIVAMSIMQLGIFSVAFGFVSYKSSGVLRRLKATPMHPLYFLGGESVARLLIGVLQVIILIGLGLAVFHLHFLGSMALFMFLAILGTIVFLAFGFAIAGRAKDENQAAPMANLVAFPQLFLSGVFFPRDSLPPLLHTITGYLPLTYLSDAMHKVANEGASFYAIRGDILGLIVWGIIAYIAAVKLFRWE